MERKKVNPLTTAAIFAIAAMGMGFTVVTPAMGVLYETWLPKLNGNETMINMISTLPTLFMMPASLLAGAVAGKKVSYKMLAICGNLLFVLGGCLPAVLTENFTLILVSRAIFGFGMGMISPLGNALILGLYDEKTSQKYLGYGTLFMNFGGIVFQLAGGYLASFGWNVTFWGHAFAIIALILSVFIQEPEVQAPDTSGAPKEKMDSYIWVTALGLFLFNIGNYPLMMNLANVFTANQVGDSVSVSIATSVYTILGCIAGFVFGSIFAKTMRFTASIGYVVCAAGQLVTYLGGVSVKSVAVASVGLGLVGFGFGLVMPALFAYIGMNTSPATVSFAISINMAINSVAGFVSSYYLKYILGNFSPATVEGAADMNGNTHYIGYLYTEFYWAIAFSLICAVLFVIANPLKNAKSPEKA